MVATLEREPIAYKRPKLYKEQREAIFTEARFSYIEASTKSGKTVGCMAWLLEQAFVHGKEGRNYWWVAPVYGQAKIAYQRIKKGFSESELMKFNDGDLTITLQHNRAIIDFRSGEKPDNLYGEDVYACVIDEASRMREESWYAIRSTLTKTRGPCRIIGNVKGRKNWFYKHCIQAQTEEDPTREYHKITAYHAIDAKVLNEEEVLDAMRSMPRHVFRELYLAEPTEDGANPFSIRHIEACIQERGLSGKDPVFWGWDLARTLDWSVGVGLDRDGQVAAFHRFREPWRVQIRNILEATGTAHAYVDATGVGDAIVDRLQEVNPYNFHPYVFTSQSKQIIMEGLAVAIQTQDVGVLDNVMKIELDNFTYEYTRTGVRYTAPEGYHDDCVCALALANHMRHSPEISKPMEVR